MNKTLEQVQQDYVKKILLENNYNITLSAKILGIGRATMYRKYWSLVCKKTNVSHIEAKFYD